MKLKELKTKNSLDLPEVTDVYIAEDLKQVLLQAVESDKPLTINAQDVLKTDTICCQLLVATANELSHKSGAKLSINNPSDTMTNAINMLGLSAALNMEG